MFGEKPREGLSSAPTVTSSTLQKLSTKENLQNFLESYAAEKTNPTSAEKTNFTSDSDTCGSILVCVMEVTRDKLYWLGTRDGVLNCLYACSQFALCHEEFVEVEKIPTISISLRTAASPRTQDRVSFDAIAQLSVQPARRLDVYATKME